MRKTVAGLFVSVDGVMEAPETWTGPNFGPEVGQTVSALIADADTLLLGRVTYETFKASFESAPDDNPVAAQMNTVRKVVVSTTLEKAEWAHSTLVNDDVESAIRSLKQEDGKNINLSGSATLVDWLLRHELLDELHLLVFPVVVGHGRRLFGESGPAASLHLSSCEQFSTGVVHLRYQPQKSS